MRVGVIEVASQRKALEKLAELIEKDTVDPIVRNAALALTNDVESRDDIGEVHAIFNAIKHGDDRVPGLENGLKYMSDPRWADFFTSPSRLLKQLAEGRNEGDCDDFSSLFCGLLGALGFVVGLRAWGAKKGEYDHVYAIVGMPKIRPTEFIGLDATVEEAEVGWEPPRGYVLNAILDGR